MDNKQKQFDQKRWEKAVSIGRAAAKLFYEKGYLETSIDDISNMASLSKGGIYHYFSSKNEILYFISTSYMDFLLKDLEEELKKVGDSFSKIQFLISRHIELVNKYMPEAKTLIHEGHLMLPKYFRIIAEKERQYYKIVENVLSDFGGGRVPEDELRVITFTLFGMCNSIYHWYNPKASITPKKLSEIIRRIFCNGMVGYELRELARDPEEE